MIGGAEGKSVVSEDPICHLVHLVLDNISLSVYQDVWLCSTSDKRNTPPSVLLHFNSYLLDYLASKTFSFTYILCSIPVQANAHLINYKSIPQRQGNQVVRFLLCIKSNMVVLAGLLGCRSSWLVWLGEIFTSVSTPGLEMPWGWIWSLRYPSKLFF